MLVSEATTRLPSWAMHSYALVVVEHLKPSRQVFILPVIAYASFTKIILNSVALLDTYAAPAYITVNPVPHHEAPLRALRTKESLSSVCFLGSHIQSAIN